MQLILTLLTATAIGPLHAQTFSTLYSFACGSDGAHPYGGLVRDSAGNLYGTTYYGGTFGKGTVFELTTAGTKTTLYNFTGNGDGGHPEAGPINDASGNLYGTTEGGGAFGHGVVFQVTVTGTETVLHSFSGSPADGSNPTAGLVVDAAGNLYGTTFSGGGHGFGTVFKVTPAGIETTLYSFSGPPSDGADPIAGLIVDQAGNLYGTTLNGGAKGLGIVFTLTSAGSETILHSFTGTDGAGPAASLLRDSSGNLYGTAYAAGHSSNGVAFKLSPGGLYTALLSFDGHIQGRDPSITLVSDSLENLFGATAFGGTGQCRSSGCGLIFELSGTKQTVLHDFLGFPLEGSNPHTGSSLISDSVGNLYGTSSGGGTSDCGTVFMFRTKPAAAGSTRIP